MRAQLLSTKNLNRNHDKFFDKFAANEFHLARDDLSFSSFFFFLSSLLSFFFSFLFFSQPIVRPPPPLQFLVSRLGHSFLSHRSLFIPFSSYLSPSPPPLFSVPSFFISPYLSLFASIPCSFSPTHPPPLVGNVIPFLLRLLPLSCGNDTPSQVGYWMVSNMPARSTTAVLYAPPYHFHAFFLSFFFLRGDISSPTRVVRRQDYDNV